MNSGSGLHATNAGQERTHHPRLLWLVVGLAMHLGFGAARRLDGCARRAALGLRAGHYRTSRPRAGRAFADLTGLVARADTGWAGRHRRLENIATHVRRGRTFRLEHIAAHVGLRWAGRNRRLQYILGPVYARALVTSLFFMVAVSVAITMLARALAYLTGALCYIDE
jgi:hypothetical protein